MSPSPWLCRFMEKTMEAKDHQQGLRERAWQRDAEIAARVQALETQWRVVVPTLATREQLEQLRGDLRCEMKEGFGAMRAEIHQIGVNSLRWSVGITISAVIAVATLMTALMPLMISQARGREAVALAVLTHGEDDGN
jgi:hypothetical protein